MEDGGSSTAGATSFEPEGNSRSRSRSRSSRDEDLHTTNTSLISLFDAQCLNFGDHDAVIVSVEDDSEAEEDTASISSPAAAAISSAVCWTELQYASLAASRQLCLRFGRPDFCLVDCGVQLVQQPRNWSPSRPASDWAFPLCPSIVLGMDSTITPIGCARWSTRCAIPIPIPIPIPATMALVGCESLQWFDRQFSTRSNSVIARRTPLTFVDGVNELLAALMAPACRLLCRPPFQCATTNTDETTLASWIVRNSRIMTRITLLPSQLEQVLLYCKTIARGSNKKKEQEHDEDVLSLQTSSSLRIVIVSGEPCPAALVRDFRQCPLFAKSVRLLNFYGQTETTGDCCWAELVGSDNATAARIVDGIVPVGRPLPGVTMRLEADTHQVLVSGATCLANGYYGDHSLSSWKSSSSSFEFATGDLGFMNNGCWYIRGRLDDVIKVNGVWSAPTEVEDAVRHVFSAATTACVAVTLDGSVHMVFESGKSSMRDGVSDAPDWFSREQMKQAGIPFHLIPKQAFSVNQIPRRKGGAAKVDRNRVRNWVQARLTHHDNQPDVGTNQDGDDGDGGDLLLNVLSQVLNVSASRVSGINESLSFVELGGDSALAVTLLYQLQLVGLLANNHNTMGSSITTQDIVTNSVRDLRELLNDNRQGGRKRLKTTSDAAETNSSSTRPAAATFRPSSVDQVDEHHSSLLFAACVDASPLVHQSFVYGACQGGVVQRIPCNCDNTKAPAGFALGHPWKIQADLTLIEKEEMIVVCGYDPEKENGLVVALSYDLATVRWRSVFDGMIKDAAVFVDGRVLVHAGHCLHTVDIINGAHRMLVTLPGSSESRPVVVNNKVVYAFSDWDAGLAVVDPATGTFTSINEVSTPIYADLLRIHDRVVAADIFGSLFDLDTQSLEVETTKISSFPIFSGPCLLGNGCSVVFGCHDGVVRCVSSTDLSTTLWEYKARAVVYARLYALPPNSDTVVACTTAGTAIVVKCGMEISRYQVDAEIWSDPVVAGMDESDPDAVTVVFGARDSRMHFVRMKCI